MAKKNNTLWYIIGGAIIVIILVIIIINLSSNRIVCNRPYIQVGESCCLDDNYNGICDNDEEPEPEPETNYRNFEVKAYITHDFMQNIEDLPSYPSKDYRNYPLYDSYDNTMYDAGNLYLYTNYDTEKVVCYIKEFYDGNLNDQFTVTIFYGSFYSTGIGYEKSGTPEVVRYDYECTGEESGNKYIGAYRVHPKID